ncbi:MAG TPA: ImmA/IrrE family metallo-endopeptidase [Corynebacterium amycolatum]|nr:ImmA/IrrE family metallo-endopeptidase [Corynebacterium amycolatum]
MKTCCAENRKETGKIQTTRFHDLAIICEIIDVTTDHHEGGPAGYYDHQTRTISTRKGLSAALFRSTLAHEIGHATFRDHPTTHDHFDQKQETRADRFAIRLLFDDDDFQAAYDWCGHDIPALAEELECSQHHIRTYMTLTRRDNP